MYQLSGTKRPDWPTHLARQIEEMREAKFDWGTHDCLLFWMKCERAQFGDSLLDFLNLKYSTKDKAEHIYNRAGCYNLFEVADWLYEPKDVSAIQRGDLVGYIEKQMESFGVYVGPGFVAPGLDGMKFMPARRIRSCWSRKCQTH